MGIADSLKQILVDNEEQYSIIAFVDSVDKDKRTCVLIPLNDPEDKLFGVRLQSKQNLDNGLVCFPLLGSEVVVTFMNSQTGYVAMFSELESIGIVIEGQTMNFDKDGLLLKSQLGSLQSVWLDLIGILKDFKLSTNSGVTIAVLPNVIGNLITLETKVKSILKD